MSEQQQNPTVTFREWGPGYQETTTVPADKADAYEADARSRMKRGDKILRLEPGHFARYLVEETEEQLAAQHGIPAPPILFNRFGLRTPGFAMIGSTCTNCMESGGWQGFIPPGGPNPFSVWHAKETGHHGFREFTMIREAYDPMYQRPAGANKKTADLVAFDPEREDGVETALIPPLPADWIPRSPRHQGYEHSGLAIVSCRECDGIDEWRTWASLPKAPNWALGHRRDTGHRLFYQTSLTSEVRER